MANETDAGALVVVGVGRTLLDAMADDAIRESVTARRQSSEVSD